MAEKLELILEELRTTMVFESDAALARVCELREQIKATDESVDAVIDEIMGGMTERRSVIVAKLHRLQQMLETYPSVPPPIPAQPIPARRVSAFDATQEMIDDFAGFRTAAS